MDNNILGKRIREARGDFSLREFAQKCNISHTHLDSLEKGADPRTGKEVSVGWETLKKLSIATGYSVHYLTGDTDDKSGGLIFRPDGSKIETPYQKRAFEPPTPKSDEDEEIWELRDMLHKQPEMKMLFSAGKGATKKDIIAAAKFIEALKDREQED